LLAKNRFSKDDLKDFLRELLALRDRITSQSGAMKSAALQRNDEVNLEEEGTDAFMRLQTLEQVGTQQGMVIKINEALDAIAKGMYGVCDNCNELISKARLAVLPFARTCIRCQAEMEQADRHGRRR
jgi:DnaK suppressor protein